MVYEQQFYNVYWPALLIAHAAIRGAALLVRDYPYPALILSQIFIFNSTATAAILRFLIMATIQDGQQHVQVED